jgi:hypothetical protein
MKYLYSKTFATVVALTLVIGVPTWATVIFHDDFQDVGDEDPLNAPLVGSWDSQTSARGKTTGSDKAMLVYGPAGWGEAYGNAIQASPAGTELRFEFKWALSGADAGLTYAPYAALAFGTYSRALSLRLVYPGGATHADLKIGNSAGDDIDSGIDVPLAGGFRQWTVDYTVGNATANLTIDGVVSDQPINVAWPGQTISGVYFSARNQTTYTRFDDVMLTVVPEPAAATLLGLAAVLLLVVRRRRA